MPYISKLFIAASLVYLAFGTAMGLLMAFRRGKWTLRLMPSHAHMNLLGWASGFLFALAYMIIPQAMGRGLYSGTLPYWHFALWNAGLIGMALMWAGSRFPKSPVPPGLVAPFGALAVISVWIFMINIAMTVF